MGENQTAGQKLRQQKSVSHSEEKTSVFKLFHYYYRDMNCPSNIILDSSSPVPAPPNKSFKGQ